jgi:D-alanine-D-alanine ligase
MTRIGFAYNQKPESSVVPANATSMESRSDEEPPSKTDVYAEWDSAETIDAVASALSAYGEVVRLEATEEFPERLRAERPDIVFNIAEGLRGSNREGHVPAICEFFDVPFSGSDPFTLSLCLHKARTKEVLTARGIPNAPFTLIESESSLVALLDRNDQLPLFESQARFLLETYNQPVIAEDFLTGAEFTCGVLGNGDGARVLPIVAINFDSLPEGAVPIYGFEAKWIWDTPSDPLDIFECPARIDPELQSAIEDVVLRAYHVLGCRDWSRIDVRLDSAGVPNIVEVNPLPGILPNPEDNSCLPKAARAAGLSYDQLIQSALIHAAQRYSLRLEPTRASVAFDSRAAGRALHVEVA